MANNGPVFNRRGAAHWTGEVPLPNRLNACLEFNPILWTLNGLSDLVGNDRSVYN